MLATRSQVAGTGALGGSLPGLRGPAAARAPWNRAATVAVAAARGSPTSGGLPDRSGAGAALATVPSPAAPASERDGTAAILENVASSLLKTRLKSYESVATEVESSFWELCNGKLTGARILGSSWASPLGLTARKLVADVGEVHLDLGAAFTRATIELSNKPKGTGYVVFNSTDFGNFLTHPLFVETSSQAVMGRPFFFDGSSVRIAPSEGCVHLVGWLSDDKTKFRVVLSPPHGAQKGVEVSATPIVDDSESPLTELQANIAAAAADTIAAELQVFFNQGMVVDLSGAELSYDSMTVDSSTDGSLDDGDLGELHLTLNLNVYKFPAIAELQF